MEIICEQLNSILKPQIRASKIKLSYVDELFPDLKDKEYIVFHKNNSKGQCSDYQNKDRSLIEYSKLDVSGSPLEYSFEKDEFEDTIIVTKQMWKKEEELYLPLSRANACNALNMCLDQVDSNTCLSILALCDGEDSKQTLLLGVIVSENWFTSIDVISTGATSLVTAKNNCVNSIKNHFKQSSSQEYPVNISMFISFDLFGIKQEMIDWDKISKNNYEGSINVQVYSNNLELDLRQSKNIMTVEINTEWKNSSLTEIRDQLLLLMKYLSIIDECNNNIGRLQDPIRFAVPCVQEYNVICEKLKLLLNGNSDFKLVDNNRVKDVDCINKKENVEIDVKLRERIQNVYMRHDVDFTDLLWEILIKTSEYSQMVRCFETVLKEILQHTFTPHANDTNSTRFIKHVYDLRHRETTSYLLVGSVPLELVVDMGFEKLIRDYQYILKGAQFVDTHDVRKKLADISSGTFSTEKYRKKLNILAQIHVSLECMLLIEEHMEYCPIESLQRLFAEIFKQFVSEQSTLQDCTELCSRIFTFTTSLPTIVANELNKIDPSVQRVCVSSNFSTAMLTTTTYYSKMPIFPMYKYPTDVNAQEEVVYGVSATSSSIRFKKLDEV
ncbi:protein zwilch homolog [Pseudomyrmex gracilis]|uniref:protein zwilch homolog n=1 Tax=Pseudomyrmex gracilis TaxID=219809 RepID=UPI000995B111|nr:protein zwilch homolog [Pseudomyrmex gracilis]